MTADPAPSSGWQRACAVADVPADVPLRVEVAGVPVAIARADGEVYAIYDVCSHENIALSEGEIDGTTIECWLHGSRFDLASGAALNLPATRPVPVYPVMLDGAGPGASVLVDVSAAH